MTVDNITLTTTKVHWKALADAAQAEDSATFVQVIQSMDWTQCSANDFTTAIHLALRAGAHLAARELSVLGQRLYPEHTELQKLAHILAPPCVSVGEHASAISRRKDFTWLKHHSAPYRGQWVALKRGKLIAAARTISELKAQVPSPENTFLAKVP